VAGFKYIQSHDARYVQKRRLFCHMYDLLSIRHLNRWTIGRLLSIHRAFNHLQICDNRRRGGPCAPPRISERGEIPVIPEALLAHLSTESGFSRNFYSSVNKWETWLHIIHVIGEGLYIYFGYYCPPLQERTSETFLSLPFKSRVLVCSVFGTGISRSGLCLHSVLWVGICGPF